MPFRLITRPPADDTSPDSFELVQTPLPTLGARERYLPFRTTDLVHWLCDGTGLSSQERTHVWQLAKLLGAVFHYEFFDWLCELKRLYSPIDPDSECLALKIPAPPCPGDPHVAFLGPFEAALVRANYVPLDLPVLEKAISSANELALDYVPNLHLFEHLRVYVRGQGRVTRRLRTYKTWFRTRTVTYDAYRRVVIALKYRSDLPLDDYVRADVLYLRMFKDVPFVEMDMHLPEQGTKIRMRWLDKLSIASPVVTGIPAVAAKLLSEAISPFLLALLVFAPISAGMRSFFGYQSARRRYLHKMIRHLYYLTMANNSSVINRLVDSGEEEEFKEAMLAYFLLWQGRDDSEPWTQERLERQAASFLFEKSGCELVFETADALNKLFRLGLAQRDVEGHLRAMPIAPALHYLDQKWDRYFNY